MGRHRQQGRTTARVVVAVLSFLIVLGAARIGLDHVLARRVEARAVVAAGRTTPTAPTGAATGPEQAVQACVRKQAAATAVVAAARRAESDWRQHLQGQTDLEAGELTLAEVKDRLWGPTRKAGPTDVADYTQATDRYAALPSCRAPSGSAAGAVTACLNRQAALDGVLTAAAPVVDDWRGHLDAMARHAAGDVSGGQAQDDWIQRWRAAGPQLVRLAAAESTLAGAPDCRA